MLLRDGGTVCRRTPKNFDLSKMWAESQKNLAKKVGLKKNINEIILPSY